MDILSRAPNTTSALLVFDVGRGLQLHVLDDPPLGQEGLVQPPVGIPLRGCSFEAIHIEDWMDLLS